MDVNEVNRLVENDFVTDGKPLLPGIYAAYAMHNGLFYLPHTIPAGEALTYPTIEVALEKGYYDRTMPISFEEFERRTNESPQWVRLRLQEGAARERITVIDYGAADKQLLPSDGKESMLIDFLKLNYPHGYREFTELQKGDEPEHFSNVLHRIGEYQKYATKFYLLAKGFYIDGFPGSRMEKAIDDGHLRFSMS